MDRVKNIFKSVVLLMVIGLFLSAFALIFTACNEHKHEFIYDTDFDATCTAPGQETGTCSCGETDVREIPALGHEWQEKITKEPTCLDDGIETRDCKRCGTEEENVVIPALGHEWEIQGSGEQAQHTHICKRDNAHLSSLSVKEGTKLTCTTDHTLIHSCEVCEYNWEEVIEQSKGHQYDGSYEARENDQHTQVCTVCHQDDENYIDCNFSEVIQTEVETCEAGGYTIKKCSDCSNTKRIEGNPAKGHDYSNPPVHIEKEEGGKLVHYHYYTCKNDERHIKEEKCEFKKETIKPSCDYTLDDEITKGQGYDEHICNSCGYSYKDNFVARLEHNWGPWEQVEGQEGIKHVRHCQNGIEHEDDIQECKIVETPHEATCKRNAYTEKTCADCHYHREDEDEGTQLEHSFTQFEDFDEEQHYKICTREGCGERVLEGHELSQHVTDATCTTDEITLYTCSICEHSHEKVTKQAPGHQWGEWKCLNANYHSHECDVCQTEVEELHDFSQSNICGAEGCGYDDLVYEKVEQEDGTAYYVVKGLGERSKQTKNVVIDETHTDFYTKETLDVVGIKKNAFFSTFPKTNSIETVTIKGEKLIYIEEMAFDLCDDLHTVILPSSLKRIGRFAFANCKLLNKVELPEGIEEFGNSVFAGTKFVSDFENGDEDILYLELKAKEDTSTPKYFLIKAKKNISGEVVVQNGTTYIANNAFENCSGMTNLILPADIKTIENDAFLGCVGLGSENGSVTFHGTVGQWFGITWGESEASSPLLYTTEFHIDLGEDDEDLDLTAYGEITRIPAGTFRDDIDHEGGYHLKSIKIPASVTFIGAHAFKDCAQLAKVEILGNNIDFIGEDAFTGTALYNNWLAGEEAVLYLGMNQEYLIAVNNQKLLENGDFVLNDNIKVIGDNAFKDCTNLTGIEINATSQLVTIGDFAFKGCANLHEIYIPQYVKLIGEEAFVGAGLKKATFASTDNWVSTKLQGGIYVGRALHLDDTGYNAEMLTKEYTLEWQKYYIKKSLA